MPEGTKHLRYKEAVQENIQGKIITIQNQVSFAVIESRFERDTLIHKGSKSRRHDIVALVLPMPNLWENPKPIMAGGGGGELGAKLARHLIVHGARPGLTPREILSLYCEGKSVGSRIGSKTLEEEYPRFQLIIEIRDTNKKTEQHKEEIQKSGHFAIEIDIRGCPDMPNDDIIAELIKDAQWLVDPREQVAP